VVAAFAAVFEKRGAPDGAGWGLLTAAGYVERLCSLALRGESEKVLKIDRPLTGGFSGLTDLWPVGCGIAAFGGDEYEVSVTGLPLVSPVRQDEEQKSPSLGKNPATFLSRALV
jgi:hypothetical protein